MINIEGIGTWQGSWQSTPLEASETKDLCGLAKLLQVNF